MRMSRRSVAIPLTTTNDEACSASATAVTKFLKRDIPMTMRTMLCTVATLTLTALPVMAQQGTPLTEEAAFAIGTDAYVYGYPLVTMEMTRRVMTNTADRRRNQAPMGQFVNATDISRRRRSRT